MLLIPDGNKETFMVPIKKHILSQTDVLSKYVLLNQ